MRSRIPPIFKDFWIKMYDFQHFRYKMLWNPVQVAEQAEERGSFSAIVFPVYYKWRDESFSVLTLRDALQLIIGAGMIYSRNLYLCCQRSRRGQLLGRGSGPLLRTGHRSYLGKLATVVPRS